MGKLYNQEIDDFYKLNKDGNYYKSILDSNFKANANIPPNSRGEDWTNYKPAKAQGNIIMFGSGWGDGLYPRYVGYNKSGEIIIINKMMDPNTIMHVRAQIKC